MPSISSWRIAAPVRRRCGPERDFTPPHRAAREQEIRHVRAGDEQHETDGGEQGEHHVRLGDAAQRLAQRLDRDGAIVVGLRVGGRELAGNGVHLCLGLGERAAGAQPRNADLPDHFPSERGARRRGRGHRGSQTSISSRHVPKPRGRTAVTWLTAPLTASVLPRTLVAPRTAFASSRS